MAESGRGGTEKAACVCLGCARSLQQGPRLLEESYSAEAFWVPSHLERGFGFSGASSRTGSATRGYAGAAYASGCPVSLSNDRGVASAPKDDRIRVRAGDLALGLGLGPYLERGLESGLSGASSRRNESDEKKSLCCGRWTYRVVSRGQTRHSSRLLLNDDGLEFDSGLCRAAHQQRPPSVCRRLLPTDSQQQQQQRQAKGVYVS